MTNSFEMLTAHTPPAYVASPVQVISPLYFHSRSESKPLRIGVMINDFHIERIYRQVLLDIQASDFARVELVIKNCEVADPSRVMPPAGLPRYVRMLKEGKSRRLLFYKFFQRYNLARQSDPTPREMVDCSDMLRALPRLDVVPIRKRFVHRFPPDAVAALREHKLDVILRFGFNILWGDVLSTARCGIWSFHHGDNDYYRGGPASFWEVLEKNPCSGAILQVLTEELDGGLVLCKSVFATVRGLWPSQNMFQPYWGSTHMVIRKLNELHEQGWETVKHKALPQAPYRGKARIYRNPTNRQMIQWLVPTFGVELLRRCNPYRTGKILQSRICLRRADAPKLIAGSTQAQTGFRWAPCPSGHFYADPFLLEDREQRWLFFEDYRYGEGGRICCAEIRSDLSVGESIVCIEPGYPLSYPFVFRHQGEIFMIPESVHHERGTAELWRAVEFPFSWKLEKTLFRGPLLDTTALFHEGIWYFFTAFFEANGNAAFGALFFSSSLTGEWVRHPDSPISTDVRYARSAGAVINLDNRLLRPVQDCSEGCGRRIHVDEISELSPDRYRGRHILSIEPEWEKGLRGVHTYNFCSGFEVLDAARLVDYRVAEEKARANTNLRSHWNKFTRRPDARFPAARQRTNQVPIGASCYRNPETLSATSAYSHDPVQRDMRQTTSLATVIL